MRTLRYRRVRRQLIRYSSDGTVGRWLAGLAAWGIAPYHPREILATLHEAGYVDPSAYLAHPRHRRGAHVYVGKETTAFADPGEGEIVFGDHVSVYGRTLFRTGQGGDIRLDHHAHVQMGCTFVACISPIRIGAYVEIAPNCSFYSCTHGVAPGKLIMLQELHSKGPIEVGEGAWLGNGVTVIQGVTIGPGAVIGAGSVVTKDIPGNAIAAGVPAKVIAYRNGDQADSEIRVRELRLRSAAANQSG